MKFSVHLAVSAFTVCCCYSKLAC